MSNFEIALTKELCIICGKEQDGDIVMNTILTEKNANQIKKLHNTVVGYSKKHCDECSEMTKEGVALVGVDDSKTKDESNPYRTGSVVVVKEELIHRMVNEDMANNIIKNRYTFIDQEIIDSILESQ